MWKRYFYLKSNGIFRNKNNENIRANMSGLIKTIKKYLPLALKSSLGRALDFLVYYCLPPKKIVLILSVMRSGSTLLKALLGEAQDISHLPEVDFRKYSNNSYHAYRKAYFLSKKRIIILKYPGKAINLAPKLDRFKFIVLTRDVYGVVQSLQNRHKDTELKHKTKFDWVRHWCLVNQRILDSVQLMNIDFCTVHYEDLLIEPRAITKKLFAFLGSKQIKGVEHYHKPKNSNWEWGQGDGGEKIKKLKVIQECSDEKIQDEELHNIIENFQEIQLLREKFGYLDNERIKVIK